MIGTVAVVASWVPVVVGVRRLSGWRLGVWQWLAFLAVENAVLRVMAWLGEPTRWVTWACYPVAVWLGVRALFGFPSMAALRPWAPRIAGAFLLAWILGGVVGDMAGGYSRVVAPLHALVLTVVALGLFLRATGPHQVLRRSPQVVAAATALTYGPFLAVWPLSLTLDPSVVLPMWEARAGLLVVGSVLYVVALW